MTCPAPDWPVTPLAASVSVVADRPMPALSPALANRVQAHWDKARETRPSLYNGRVFCADHIEPERISGHWSEYRRVFAQMQEPDLFGKAPLRPLAVVGLLKTRDGIMIGQRAQQAVYLSGWWQGTPAGNVESRTGTEEIDLPAQLLAEAAEELGLSAQDCRTGPCLLACEHPQTHIMDVGIRLDVSLGFSEVLERCQSRGNGEYAALRLLTAGQPLPHPTVPTLSAMLEHA
ncbi:hypothetical protein [Gluconobacter morbifer]|uniref:Nudix hydrolase domain-containing protein n=1 Tax=Gluconobacter morbifer G707 TaxID=1088869 RepID=G6XG75_9PROT|nr:hypothetical protein [Gluconobacter morbifer]EHH69183.1 hypothetical protein GMO_04900 [Gluconobacter morbifer G707]